MCNPYNQGNKILYTLLYILMKYTKQDTVLQYNFIFSLKYFIVSKPFPFHGFFQMAYASSSSSLVATLNYSLCVDQTWSYQLYLIDYTILSSS